MDRPSAGARVRGMWTRAGVAAGELRSGHIQESSGFPEGPDQRKNQEPLQIFGPINRETGSLLRSRFCTENKEFRIGSVGF